MAGGIVALQRSRAAPGSRSSGASAGDLARGLGWFSVGFGVVELLVPGVITRPLGMREHKGLVRTYGVREIGTGIGILASKDPMPWVWGRVGGDALDIAAVAAGLGGRHSRKGGVLFALITLAGVTALDVICGAQLRRASSGKAGSAPTNEPEVERSITIGKTADELYQRWRDPKTLPQVMAFLATVRASGGGRMRWQVEGPLGRSLEWETETVGDHSGEGAGWRSLPGAGIRNEGAIRFHPATGGRGTVATLRLRFDPPGGALGDAAVRLLAATPLGLAADQALHRFKSLAETGEIPTTARQPAARADTR